MDDKWLGNRCLLDFQGELKTVFRWIPILCWVYNVEPDSNSVEVHQQLIHNRHPVGWSEPAATSAPVQDEAVQAILGMNQKHILFPCPGIFSPLRPKIFPSYLLPSPPSYLPHLISHSLHL
jgi:hypothetical protein